MRASNANACPPHCIPRILVRCSFANANVLLVLGELMGEDEEDGRVSKTAIPLIAGAIVCAQVTMAIATVAGITGTAVCPQNYYCQVGCVES